MYCNEDIESAAMNSKVTSGKNRGHSIRSCWHVRKKGRNSCHHHGDSPSNIWNIIPALYWFPRLRRPAGIGIAGWVQFAPLATPMTETATLCIAIYLVCQFLTVYIRNRIALFFKFIHFSLKILTSHNWWQQF